MSGRPAVPGLDFTAIDFETANGFRGSPCSVGLVRVRDGRMAERASWLMRPPEGFDRFDPRNVRIHGITADQVAGAPRFAEVFEEMAAFIGADPLVAHNARFDLGVIESALEVSEREVPQLDYTCTLVMARKVYDLPSYALPKASAHAGYVHEHHHDALADAEACAAIMVDTAARVLAEHDDAAGRDAADSTVLSRALSARGLALSRLAGHGWAPEQCSRATRQARAMADVFDARVPLRDTRAMPDFMRWPEEGTNPPPAADADPDGPLYRQHLVFTGALGMSRQTAKLRAAKAGARTGSRVTGSTTMLVVGDGFSGADIVEDARGIHARSGAEETSSALAHRKTRDAVARRRKGQRIVLVSEPEFLQMLDGNWPAGSR